MKTITSPSTGAKVRIVKVPNHMMIAIFAAVYELILPKGDDWDDMSEDGRGLFVDNLVFKSLDMMVSKGYVQINSNQFKTHSEEAITKAINMGRYDIANILRNDRILMLRNVILNEMFPRGNPDKYYLWAQIVDTSDLSELIDIGINPMALAMEGLNGS